MINDNGIPAVISLHKEENGIETWRMTCLQLRPVLKMTDALTEGLVSASMIKYKGLWAAEFEVKKGAMHNAISNIFHADPVDKHKCADGNSDARQGDVRVQHPDCDGHGGGKKSSLH